MILIIILIFGFIVILIIILIKIIFYYVLILTIQSITQLSLIFAQVIHLILIQSILIILTLDLTH